MNDCIRNVASDFCYDVVRMLAHNLAACNSDTASDDLV